MGGKEFKMIIRGEKADILRLAKRMRARGLHVRGLAEKEKEVENIQLLYVPGVCRALYPCEFFAHADIWLEGRWGI